MSSSVVNGVEFMQNTPHQVCTGISVEFLAYCTWAGVVISIRSPEEPYGYYIKWLASFDNISLLVSRVLTNIILHSFA